MRDIKTLIRTVAAVGAALGIVASAAACGSSKSSASSTKAAAVSSGSAATQVRLGYFANVTHATAVVGVAHGDFAKALGSTKLSTQVYNAGPAEMTAVLGGQLDAAYVGPSSALSAFVQSHGEALKIVAGATEGGAELVVKPSIASAADLKGKTLATPQKGNTQDVALRFWLKQQGLTANPDGSGDVSVNPQDNATTLDQFKAGHIDGAWLPEPWASRLVEEAGAKVLVDERSLWPNSQFSTTTLVVATTFLTKHPDTVRALIDGQIAANTWITSNPADAQKLVNSELKRLTGKALTDAEIQRSFSEQKVTNNPDASTLQTSLDHAVAVNLLKSTDLHGIFDLSILNAELTKNGQPTVSDAGLAKK
ncbi:aliphatic sulfonates family ABC transporter, periplsmic ligand-binding protein [Catenulispora acidiphila DSM 44928]|uniref:Aliphatic sulfonates family ABC transporter, periplsmic ligand-binding protein n=1 Tax=Catenulispora acidiphila (strain DSM 44928 / JCM 14897 / NBRC 102108 / NRRL B-24433 / ID139908) TaxID=479433 RepID=C7QJS7_CATAD|nr:ABC transporter substrate-binding protein [Catenulispora acidiphila]ACU73165.1 aliphatic sulfonates family ABC transporter, periplsmic ligand-binding protein [Catenulispora acidiphila DSM 44928]